MECPFPGIPIPLAAGEGEPILELNEVLHGLYRRARFDLRIRHDRPPEPPLAGDDDAWARALVETAR